MEPITTIRVYEPSNNPSGEPGWLAATEDRNGDAISGLGTTLSDALRDLAARLESKED